MGKAVGYVRVSTEEQAALGCSIEAQKDRLAAYARLHGLQLNEIFVDDGVSASLPLSRRPKGAVLFELAARGEVSDVIVVKLDRLFRNATEALATLEAWEKRGIRVHFVDQGGSSINTGSALGRFFILVLAGIAEMERNLIAERTRAALEYKRLNGQVYAPEPFGYKRNGDRLEPASDEQRALAVIRELRAQGKSIRQICRELEKLGVRPKRGSRWAPSTIHGLLRRMEVGR